MLFALKLPNNVLCGLLGEKGNLYWIASSLSKLYHDPTDYEVSAFSVKNVAHDELMEDYPLNILRFKVIQHDTFLQVMKHNAEAQTIFNLFESSFKVDVKVCPTYPVLTLCSSPHALDFWQWIEDRKSDIVNRPSPATLSLKEKCILRFPYLHVYRTNRAIPSPLHTGPTSMLPSQRKRCSSPTASSSSTVCLPPPAVSPGSSPLYTPTSPCFVPETPPRLSTPSFTPESALVYSGVSSSYVPGAPPRYAVASPESSSNYSPVSPPYVPEDSPKYSAVSPSYDPEDSLKYLAVSPPYDPEDSPKYSPDSPSYVPEMSPKYSPVSPSYVPERMRYTPRSPSVSPPPSYVPERMRYTPRSPSVSPPPSEYSSDEDIKIYIKNLPAKKVRIVYGDYNETFYPRETK